MPVRCRSKVRFLRLMIVLKLGFYVICCHADELTPQQEHGRQIFFKGVVDGEAPSSARIGAGSTIVSATVAPCANCHGEDGHGRSEGTIMAPDINWKSLSNPIRNFNKNGQSYDAFTEQTFAKAVTQGVAPYGAMLNQVMPRYSFNSEQIHALVEYLKIIEADQSPGVTNQAIRIGLVQSDKPELQAVSESILSFLRRVFDSLNIEGGIYGRRIDVDVITSQQKSEGRFGYVRPDYFALLDPFPDASSQITKPNEGMIPLIAAAPPLLRNDHTSQNHEFYLFGGIQENIEILFSYLASLPEGAHAQIGVIGSKEMVSQELSQYIVHSSRVYDWSSPIIETYSSSDYDPGKTVAQLRSQAVSVILYLGDRDKFYTLLAEIQAQAWSPVVLLPTPVIDDRAFNLSEIISQRLVMTYPFNLVDQMGQGEFKALLHSMGLAAGNLALQRMAYGLAQVLIAGLKDAGRELTITRFVSALTRLNNLETGVLHPVSYGFGRRIGAPGAYIFGIDVATRRFIRKSDWHEAVDQAGRIGR